MTIIIGNDREGSREPRHVEEEVERRLNDIDRLLGLHWNEALQRYAITCTWHETDPRWEMYRSGEIGAPYDILGWFTEAAGEGDWQEGSSLPVSPLELMDKVVEFLGRMDQTRETWKQRMRKSIEHNAELQRKVRKEYAEEMTETLKDHRKQIMHEPSIRGASFDALGNVVHAGDREVRDRELTNGEGR